MPYKYLEDARRHSKEYYYRNHKKMRKYFKNYVKNNRDKANKWYKNWKNRHRDRYRAIQRKYRYELRRKVFKLYGNKCVCCGETEFYFLSIDHINGGGLKHRKKYGCNRNWYRYILRYKPKFLQILCFNCNLSKGFWGFCPHKLENKNVL